MAISEAQNQSWPVDFMYDVLIYGRRFRTFNVIDDVNREALSIEIELNLPATLGGVCTRQERGKACLFSYVSHGSWPGVYFSGIG